MKKLQYVIPLICSLAVCVSAAGCGRTERAKQPEPEVEAANLSSEQKDVYQQMALYIQEGLRTYDVEGTYQAYFEEIKETEDISCDILLEGENEWWEERISGSYDVESGWYTFAGSYEPIFLENPSEQDQLRKNSDFVTNMRENYVYSAQISRDQDIVSDIHYHSDSGPVECDFWKMESDTEEMNNRPYFLRPYLYTYYDDRMDLYITIEYPQLRLDDNTLEGRINAELKKAFFYSYFSDETSLLNPREQMYGGITRNYVITRQDEIYFSVRIFEYNDFRAANHPNEWENGITINLKTGEVLRLRDVIGEDWTPVSLLDTGAFHCMWGDAGSESDDETMIQMVSDYWERYDTYATLEALDDRFYVTPDGLGLISLCLPNSYVVIESTFAELGVEGL